LRDASLNPIHMSNTGRPEERGVGNADVYYDRVTTDRYTEHNALTQRELTTRCLDLLCLDKSAGGKDEVLLDLGCGSGLSGETLATNGHRGWVGCDASAAMLERATRSRTPFTDEDADVTHGADTKIENPSLGAVVRCDFAQGLPFRGNCFDGIVSVSAAQWLCAGQEEELSGKKLSRFFQSVTRILKPNKTAALQVYPKDVQETFLWERGLELCEGIDGSAVVGFPHARNKARKMFVCLIKLEERVVITGNVKTQPVETRCSLENGNWNDEATKPCASKSAANENETSNEKPKPPRCPCAWPHAATCEVAWGRFSRASLGQCIDDDSMLLSRETKERSTREHLTIQRRALRSLRRARGLRFLPGERHEKTQHLCVKNITAWDVETHGHTVRTELLREIIVTDGSLCPCASVGVLSVGVVVRTKTQEDVSRKTTETETTEKPRDAIDATRKRKKEPHPPGLENQIRLVALGDALKIEPTGASNTKEVTFQEFLLETDFGNFGVCALEVDAIEFPYPQIPVSSASAPGLDCDTPRVIARHAIAALRNAGRNVLCAHVLLRDDDDKHTGCQVWCVWWPSRPVGGKSRLPNDGFETTPLMREKLKSAFARL